MSNPKYRAYLASPKWKAKRDKRVKKDKGKCVACGSKVKLNVHHLTYKRIFKERMSDLVTLCNKCHNYAHKRYTLKEKLQLLTAKVSVFVLLAAVVIILIKRG